MNMMQCRKCKSVIPISFFFCPNCGRQTVDPPISNRRRAKGSGSVYKLSGNRNNPWVAKLCGKIIGCFPDRAAAESFLAMHYKASPSMLSLTLKQIYERLQESHAFKGLAEGSRKNIAYSWKRFLALENKKMRDLKTTDLQNVVDNAVSDGCGRDGCAKIKNLASMLCQNAMMDDIISRDYSEGVELPERVEYVKRRNFTQDEIITLFYNDSDKTARVILIMIYTALRLGELFGILKRDVSIENSYMMGGEKTEAGRNRIIPIKEEILPYILELMQEPGEFLVSTEHGKAMHEGNFRNRNFYPLLDRLGFKYKDENGRNVLTPHRTRHTYISGG